jgi:hypothetical protein
MMAGRKAGSPSRSEFIRKVLATKADAKLADINEAWKKAGHSGEITTTLFYQVKSKSGHSKRRGGKRRGRPPGSGRAASAVVGDSSGYIVIEQALDQLIAVADRKGDRDLADSLRTARRHVFAKLV